MAGVVVPAPTKWAVLPPQSAVEYRGVEMTAERFRQIRNVFEAAMDHGETDRTAWLAEACQGDTGLRAEVDALLKQYEKHSGVLDASAVEALPGARLEGRRIGAWEILRESGRCGRPWSIWHAGRMAPFTCRRPSRS